MLARAFCARFARDESSTLHHPRISNRWSPRIRNQANSLTTNEKNFSNRYFFGRFGLEACIRQSRKAGVAFPGMRAARMLPFEPTLSVVRTNRPAGRFAIHAARATHHWPLPKSIASFCRVFCDYKGQGARLKAAATKSKPCEPRCSAIYRSSSVSRDGAGFRPGSYGLDVFGAGHA